MLNQQSQETEQCTKKGLFATIQALVSPTTRTHGDCCANFPQMKTQITTFKQKKDNNNAFLETLAVYTSRDRDDNRFWPENDDIFFLTKKTMILYYSFTHQKNVEMNIYIPNITRSVIGFPCPSAPNVAEGVDEACHVHLQRCSYTLHHQPNHL